MSLSVLISEARLLLEANPDQSLLLTIANSWRECIRLGEQMLDAIDRAVSAAEAAVAAETSPAARNAQHKAGVAVKQVKALSGRIYGHFVTGREAVYEFAKRYRLSTRRASPAGRRPQDLRMQSDEEILRSLVGSAKGLRSGMRGFLEKGAKLGGSQGVYRLAARQPEALRADIVANLLEVALDFRSEASSVLFARINGVMRRLAELSRRAWELLALEQALDGWDPPWLRDPEIGAYEL